MKQMLCIMLLGCSLLFAQFQYPVTSKSDQTDAYFGKSIPDPYRWLEDDRSTATAGWVKSQNDVTFGYLEKIPFRNKVRDRITKLVNYPKYGAPFRAGKNWYFYKNDGLQNQSALYIQRGSLEAKVELFLDPNKLSGDGTTSLADVSFSKDGKYAAYSVSKAGSDWREIFVMDVKTKKLLKDKIEWAKFTGITWRGNGFYYNRYDIPKDTGAKLSASNEFQKVYYHVLGTAQSKDELMMEDKENPHMGFGVGLTEDQKFMTLSKWQRNVNGNALYYRDMVKKTDWMPILETFDNDIYVIDNDGGKLLIYTNYKAPNGRVISFDPANPSPENWTEILPEKPEALTSVSIIGSKLFAIYMKDVSNRVYVHDLKGKFENEISLETIGTVGGFSGERKDQITYYTLTSFTYPSVIYKYDLKAKQSTLYRKTDVDFDPNAFETKQVFYPSKDGTKIPMFIVHKKGIPLDGNNPTWLYGYGGFNVSINPSFSAVKLAWIEQGGIYAVANLRGGSEYGEEWHKAGMKMNKQNVFDDFIAAAEYLIA
jgi:prolyl oligopeptidase